MPMYMKLIKQNGDTPTVQEDGKDRDGCLTTGWMLKLGKHFKTCWK